MAETVILDPSAIAVSRTQLDITNWVAASGTGIDWGDAAIQAYTASVTVGEVRLHYRLPNRLIKIPLVLRNIGATTFLTIRQQLQAKVGLFQRENGWLGRTTDAGTLYADIQNATLHLGGSWLQAYRGADVDAVLALECLPDWYGAEVTLSTHTETVLPHLFFTETTINGNYPGRVRIQVTNGTTVDQHSLLWGLRSRYYDSGTTAALFYEAEALLPLNGAAGTALSGASGGSAVAHSALPANVWASILTTNMVSGTVPLTHVGSYRVYARVFSGSATPQLRLQWGVGSLAVPEVNDAVQLPGAGQFYLLDLGECRLDIPPVGPNQWFGAIQANVASANDQIAIDAIWLQPLDDGAGKLTYVSAPPASSLGAGKPPTVAANDAAVGSVAWTNTSLALALDNTYAQASLTTGQISQWLKTTSYGFSIPSSATIRGILTTFWWAYNGTGALRTPRLVKAGAVQSGVTSNEAYGPYAGGIAETYGSPTDLWGGSWAPSDINNSGFGCAFSFNQASGGSGTAYLDYVLITVYYTLATGFTVGADAVIAASKTTELRSDGAYRQSSAGTIYGPVSTVIGDLPRVPPAGLEGRTVQVFLKASRGNLTNEPDSAIDDLSAQVIYRPSYLYTP